MNDNRTRIRELEKQVDYLSGALAKEQLKVKDMQVGIKMLEADVDRIKRGLRNGRIN